MICILLLFFLFVQPLVCSDHKDLDALYEQHKHDSAELIGLAKTCLDSSAYEQAYRFCKQAYAMNAAHGMQLWKICMRLDRYDEALKIVHEQHATIGLPIMEHMMALGSTYNRLHETEKADTCFKAVLLVEPMESARYWHIRANTLLHIRSYHEAIDCYKKVLELLIPDAHVTRAGILFNTGHALIQLRQYNEAVEHLKGAIKLNPNVAQYHDSLGTAYAKLHKQRKAKKSFNEALILYPSLTTALNDLGNYYRRKGKHAQAKDYFNRVIAIDPRYTAAYLRLGRSYMAEGHKDEALAHLEKALALTQYEEGRQKVQKYIKQIETMN